MRTKFDLNINRSFQEITSLIIDSDIQENNKQIITAINVTIALETISFNFIHLTIIPSTSNI